MITVEDVNSVMSKYGVYTMLHEIDTSKIGTGEYEDVKYDFCICKHTIFNDIHTFYFDIKNSNWNGEYYFKTTDGHYITGNASYDSSTGILSFSTSLSSVILVLYCLNIDNTFNVSRFRYVPIESNVLIVDYEDLGSTVTIYLKDLKDNVETSAQITLTPGLNTTYNILVLVRKFNFDLILNETNLIMGKVNHVTFDNTEDVEAECIVTYLDKSNTFNLTDEGFDIDLTDYNSNKSINVDVQILEDDVILPKIIEYKLPVSYVQVDNYADMVNQIQSGASIVELTNNITFYDDVIVSHDLMIIGNDYDLTMSMYAFNVANDCTFKINDVNVNGGNPVILQAKDSKVDISGCKFVNAKNTKYNNLGSIISCDIDIDSLEVLDDFTTNITECIFVNNHNCILHGGSLTVSDCKYLNFDMDYVDINNAAFLYQVDGDANIVNSVFDIDYGEDSSFEEENIMYGQALFMCGETAIINDANYINLSADNNVNWSNAPYNNRSHIYCKYYYPQIEEIVYSSPTLGKEDKAVCYCVSGKDWIFKENVQVTRASWESQNTIRKINWGEDIKIITELAISASVVTGLTLRLTGSSNLRDNEPLQLLDRQSETVYDLNAGEDGVFQKDFTLENNGLYVFQAHKPENEYYSIGYSNIKTVYVYNGTIHII